MRGIQYHKYLLDLFILLLSGYSHQYQTRYPCNLAVKQVQLRSNQRKLCMLQMYCCFLNLRKRGA
jgi:hypothetical protein